MSTDTIPVDVSDQDGFDAFLSSFSDDEDPKQASTKTKANEAETPEVDAPESDETNTEAPEDDAGEQEKDPDDAEIEIKVGDEVKKATLKELKRLYGQEASLTQKSQALAQQRAAADANFTAASTALKAMTERATEANRPYAELDWFVLSQKMDPETFQALRQDAQAAEANVKFYETELKSTVEANQRQAQMAHQEAAAACVKFMEDPTTGIPGFGKPMYDEMLGFAKEQGFDNAHMITKPGVLKLLNMAMQWHKSQSATKTAEEKISKAPNKPTTVVKPGSKSNQSPTRTAMQQLRKTGSTDDATDAFLASFKS